MNTFWQSNCGIHDDLEGGGGGVTETDMSFSDMGTLCQTAMNKN